VWDKPRTSSGTGGFIRYAVKTCINHLKVCRNHPDHVSERAQVEGASPKKPRYSPYQPARPGVTSVPGIFPSGSTSSQMLPPSLPPSTRFNSPALHLQTSALPSPAISTLPSPQLSALPSPFINTFPLSNGSHHPLYLSDQSPAMSTPLSLCVEPATSHALQPTPPSGWGNWSQALQEKFEMRIARLTASAGFPLSWVDNPEWIDFIYEFLPAAKSPSRKALTARLIPKIVEHYRQIAKDSSRGQNATIQADGWTASNFHHLLAFMIAVKKKVGSATHCSE
jgi:hypothetical protein